MNFNQFFSSLPWLKGKFKKLGLTRRGRIRRQPLTIDAVKHLIKVNVIRIMYCSIKL